MQGAIVSITDSYGFIKADKASYYFNRKSMAAGSDFTELRIGSLVSFDEVATPRGMAASNLTQIEAHYADVLSSRVIITDRSTADALDGRNSELNYVTGVWSRSSQEAKNMLINSLREAGCNCITGLQEHVIQMSKGNYIYSMRTWSCTAGLHFESVAVPADYQFEESHDANLALCKQVTDRVLAIDAENEAEREGVTANHTIAYILIGILIFLFFALINSIL